MSFFGNILAGAAGGLGQGISNYAAMEERDRREEEARQEKAALALQLQQQRSEDARYRVDQAREMREMAAAARGGTSAAGKGGSGINLMQMAIEAAQSGDPAAQDLVVRLTNTFEGKNAAANLAENFYGRPMQESVTTGPTTGDLARLDRGQTDEAPVTQTMARNVSFDAQKGAQDLQRLYALALDPAKLDDQAKGERQHAQNDFGVAAARQVGKQTGGDREAMGEAFGTISNPTLNTSGQDLRQQTIDATNRRTDATLTNGAANRGSREKTSAEKLALDAVKSAQKALENARSADRPRLQQELNDAKRRYQAMVGGDADLTVTPTASGPAPFVYTPRPPAQAAAAYARGQR